MINFPGLIHSILSSTGEISEEIFGRLKEYFKVLGCSPTSPLGSQGIMLLLRTQSLSKDPHHWEKWFFKKGVSLIFENYKLLPSLTFSLNFFKCNLDSLLKWKRTIYDLWGLSRPALHSTVVTNHKWQHSTWNMARMNPNVLCVKHTSDIKILTVKQQNIKYQ